MRPRLKKRGVLSKKVLSRQQHKTYFHNTSSRFQPSSHYVSANIMEKCRLDLLEVTNTKSQHSVKQTRD